MTKTIILYGLKTCDTCRKAEKALDAGGWSVTFRDVRAEPLSAEERARFLSAFGEVLINRRSTTWRNLEEDTRAKAPEDLLAAHPTLMKRPVLVAGDQTWLGFDAAVRADLL